MNHKASDAQIQAALDHIKVLVIERDRYIEHQNKLIEAAWKLVPTNYEVIYPRMCVRCLAPTMDRFAGRAQCAKHTKAAREDAERAAKGEAPILTPDGRTLSQIQDRIVKASRGIK